MYLKCRICGKLFKDMNSLVIHLLEHDEVRARLHIVLREYYQIVK